jgi:hypothetical protein
LKLLVISDRIVVINGFELKEIIYMYDSYAVIKEDENDNTVVVSEDGVVKIGTINGSVEDYEKMLVNNNVLDTLEAARKKHIGAIEKCSGDIKGGQKAIKLLMIMSLAATLIVGGLFLIINPGVAVPPLFSFFPPLWAFFVPGVASFMLSGIFVLINVVEKTGNKKYKKLLEKELPYIEKAIEDVEVKLNNKEKLIEQEQVVRSKKLLDDTNIQLETIIDEINKRAEEDGLQKIFVRRRSNGGEN